ncbi:uncharacterized protein LOC123700018 isoform X2 [Colias croceus]|uniref:uncharacterized protein LOC123700018 isoform X2 n=1 Tax=Colias crocea TaxID=72248 RepID=UPI001E2818C7|nr:uncharacterized protein LOC123700018 isoform X2 [Colias croceus]
MARNNEINVSALQLTDKLRNKPRLGGPRKLQFCPTLECSKLLSDISVEAHLAECPYKEFVCPTNTIFNGCPWKGNIGNIMIHFDCQHKEFRQTQVNEESILHIGQNYRIMQLISKGQFQFLLYINVSQSSNQIQIAVQMLETKITASQWTFKIRIYGKNEGLSRFVEYIDTCYSIDETLDNSCLENKSTIISLDYAKTFANEDVIPYKLYLSNAMDNNNKSFKDNKSFQGTSRSPRPLLVTLVISNCYTSLIL